MGRGSLRGHVIMLPYHLPPPTNTHYMHRQQSETEVEEDGESLWHLSSFNAFTGLVLLLEVTERERESEHEMVVRVMMMGCYNGTDQRWCFDLMLLSGQWRMEWV